MKGIDIRGVLNHIKRYIVRQYNGAEITLSTDKDKKTIGISTPDLGTLEIIVKNTPGKPLGVSVEKLTYHKNGTTLTYDPTHSPNTETE